MEITFLQELDKYFSKKSMMEILGVDRDENTHSKFLAWLFEKPDALSHMLALLNERQPKVPVVDNAYRIVSITEDFFIINGEKCRADILITIYPKEKELPFYIVIENKVYSDEHTHQTSKYFEHYKEKYKDRVFYVFLTLPERLRLPYQKTKEPECEEFISITYQDITSCVLDNLKGDSLVDDYIQCLGISYWQEKKVMAFSKDFADLLNSFWKENKGLIKQFCQVDGNYSDELKDIWYKQSSFLRTVIKALAGMPKDLFDGTTEDYECVNKLNTVINGKDFTHYTINNGELLGKNELIYTLVSMFVERKPETTFEELQTVFPETWRMKPYSKSGTLTNQIVIGKDRYDKEVKDKNDWRKLESISEDVYILRTLWDGKLLMRKVIEKVKEIEELKDVSITEIDDINLIWLKMNNKH